MTKTIRALGLAVALGAVATAANATTYNLGTLIANDQSITIGDKVFSDFNFVSSDFNASATSVTPSIGSDGIYYLSFQAPWTAINGAAKSFVLQYAVEAVGPSQAINMIDQNYTHSAGGQGGFINIVETVRTGSYTGSVVAQSTLGFIPNTILDTEDPVTEATQGDDLIVDPPATKLYVQKDVFFAANLRGIVSPSIIRQSFHQVTLVADGGVMVIMLGAALSGLGLIRRRSAA